MKVQWMNMSSDQISRFNMYRDRKSLIGKYYNVFIFLMLNIMCNILYFMFLQIKMFIEQTELLIFLLVMEMKTSLDYTMY